MQTSAPDDRPNETTTEPGDSRRPEQPREPIVPAPTGGDGGSSLERNTFAPPPEPATTSENGTGTVPDRAGGVAGGTDTGVGAGDETDHRADHGWGPSVSDGATVSPANDDEKTEPTGREDDAHREPCPSGPVESPDEDGERAAAPLADRPDPTTAVSEPTSGPVSPETQPEPGGDATRAGHSGEVQAVPNPGNRTGGEEHSQRRDREANTFTEASGPAAAGEPTDRTGPLERPEDGVNPIVAPRHVADGPWVQEEERTEQSPVTGAAAPPPASTAPTANQTSEPRRAAVEVPDMPAVEIAEVVEHQTADDATETPSPSEAADCAASAPGPEEPEAVPEGHQDAVVPSEQSDVPRETPKVPQMPTPTATRTMVVANQKGGVGKTTTSVNLAAALALGGLSVLVVDLDPQGNASTALGVDHAAGTKGTYEVLIDGDPIADYVVESREAPRLQVLPATVDLAGAEIELVSVVARENRLKRAVKKYVDENRVDYVLIDCPPSLGLLTLNALVAAREVLIPIQCEYYALEGVSQLMNTVDLVMAELNDDLVLSTVLLTMYDARTRLAAQVADEVRAYFAEQTIPTVIPRSVRISEAPSYGQTVLTYHPESAGAVSYLEAAHEIARRGVKEQS